MEGIQNVERVSGGEVEHDSGDEADEPNGGVSLEEEDIEDEEPWAPQDIRGALF